MNEKKCRKPIVVPVKPRLVEFVRFRLAIPAIYSLAITFICATSQPFCTEFESSRRAPSITARKLSLRALRRDRAS